VRIVAALDGAGAVAGGLADEEQHRQVGGSAPPSTSTKKHA
jgi:hypothetical protein